MHIKKIKTTNKVIYYLCKSYRDTATNKSTSKVIEKIGTEEEIQKKAGKNESVDEWLKEYLKKQNAKQKDKIVKFKLEFDQNKKIIKNQRKLYNVGFFAIQNICYEIGLDEILNDISKKTKFPGNLFQIVVSMIYNRIINPFDEINTYDFSRSFIYPPKITKQQLYRAIDVLSENAVNIQYALYKKFKNLRTGTDNLYFDRQSYIFDLEQSTSSDSWVRKNNLLVDYELTMDAAGIPIAYNLPNKFIDIDSHVYKELQSIINKDWSKSQIIIFNSTPEEDFSKKLISKFDKYIFVAEQEISKLPNDIKNSMLSDDSWNMTDSSKVYDLQELKEKLISSNTSYSTYRKFYNSYFYKSKLIKVRNQKTNQVENKNLIVFFSIELRKIHEEERLDKILAIKNKIDRIVVQNLDNMDEAFEKILNKYSNILLENKESKDEIKNKYVFKEDVFSYGKDYDGVYALLVDEGEYNVEEIIKVHADRWQIHRPFENVNLEFKYTPEYIKHENSIGAHILVSTIMLAVWRMYVSRFKSKSYSWEIAKMLYSMNYLEVPGFGWVPVYNHTEVTELINKISGLDIDYEFVSEQKMKSLFQNPYK